MQGRVGVEFDREAALRPVRRRARSRPRRSGSPARQSQPPGRPRRKSCSKSERVGVRLVERDRVAQSTSADAWRPLRWKRDSRSAPGREELQLARSRSRIRRIWEKGRSRAAQSSSVRGRAVTGIPSSKARSSAVRMREWWSLIGSRGLRGIGEVTCSGTGPYRVVPQSQAAERWLSNDFGPQAEHRCQAASAGWDESVADGVDATMRGGVDVLRRLRAAPPCANNPASARADRI